MADNCCANATRRLRECALSVSETNTFTCQTKHEAPNTTLFAVPGGSLCHLASSFCPWFTYWTRDFCKTNMQMQEDNTTLCCVRQNMHQLIFLGKCFPDATSRTISQWSRRTCKRLCYTGFHRHSVYVNSQFVFNLRFTLLATKPRPYIRRPAESGC